MNTLTDDARWAEWRSWFETAHQDISTLFHHQHVWRNVVAMLQGDHQPEIAHHSTVNDWLTRGYCLVVPLIGRLSNRQFGRRLDDLLTRGGPAHDRDLG